MNSTERAYEEAKELCAEKLKDGERVGPCDLYDLLDMESESERWKIRRAQDRAHVSSDHLEHLVMQPEAGCVVAHVGDPLDFRRDQLVVMTREQWVRSRSRLGNKVRWSAT